MSQEKLSVAPTEIDAGQQPATSFLTDRHRHIVDQINAAYNARQPVAVMIGEGASVSSFVINSFASTLPPEVAFAHIEEPCANATEFMGKIIDAVGFEPKDLCLEDLEGIFTMFLSFQKSHSRRTVLCVERAQEHDEWVLDKLRSLIEKEGEAQHGLMVVISGQSGLKEMLHTGPLSEISVLARNRIILPPFTIDESKQFIRQRLETAGKLGIDQLFQFQAITRIHELSRGVPDEVAALVNRCLESAAAEGVSLITSELVERAFDWGQSANDHNEETVNMQGFRPSNARLVMQLTGEDVGELQLRQGHTLIGRSALCDVRIESSMVSRRHALVSYSSDGAYLVDLNSTNGTFVDGHQIRRHELKPGETIELGGTKIEYVVEDEIYASEMPASSQVRH